ncbi:F-box/kelch-repeat protein At3g23880-like [Coffea eugenioides]|uniref:F-box/kelch-repeat protein At3g23880-like n=1 Tax=Coffea eugenioides TaxID=49369 RepID=UPI000F611501|nr:F-box/kelch-repeat protein At3g23880-like [Coffea eugenioides]
MESKAPKVPYAHLPPELIFDILLRLPIKSLLRFRCVSKSWNSLISSPEFIKTHLKKTSNARNTKLIFSSFKGVPDLDYLTECNLDSVLYSPTIEAINMVTHMVASSMTEATTIQPPKEKSIEILGSCNGLVCIAMQDIRFWPFDSDSTPDRRLFLWNPSIRKYWKLPHFGNSGVAAYGFGYDELHDDYKLMAFFRASPFENAEGQVVEIYSQRTNSWKRNEYSINYPIWQLKGGCFVGGKLHWNANFRPEEEDRYRPRKVVGKIVSFDLAHETCGVIEFPENYKGKSSGKGWSIGVLGGRMPCFPLDSNSPGLECRIGFDIDVQPVFLTKRGELLLKLESSLVLYNPEDGTYKNLDMRYKLRYLPGLLKVDMCDESLVLLDAHDGLNMRLS